RHRLAKQQRRTRRGTTRIFSDPGPSRRIVTPSAERQLLDGKRRVAVLEALERILLRVRNAARPLRSVVGHAKDVGQAATMAGEADDGRERTRGTFRQKQVAQRAQIVPGVEDDLLTGPRSEVCRFEHLGVEWRAG